MEQSNVVFVILFSLSIFFFVKNLRRIIANIRLGRNIDRSDRPWGRWKNMNRKTTQNRMTPAVDPKQWF